MKPTIAQYCGHCKKYSETVVATNKIICCSNCQKQWGAVKELSSIFDYCPVCQCRQFYFSKDFNQLIGCLIVLIGIILVPFTYGLSLPVFALIDWVLHKRVPTIINCYKCGAEFRGFSNIRNFKPFMHHIGLKYDKYRSNRGKIKNELGY